jgi:4'-phosphopantetheinyl transferase
MTYNKIMTTKNRITLLHTDILKDPHIYDLYYGQMPEDRQKKIDRFRFDKDKRLSLGAGILLKLALDQAGISLTRPNGTGTADDTDAGYSQRKIVELSFSEQGKPFIKDRDDLYFNLSHSGQLAACVLSDRPVGIDIEGRQTFKESLIRRVFAQEDLALAKRAEREKELSLDKICTLLWTVKESVMKYFGKGLSMDPAGIRVVSAEKKNGSVWDWKIAGYEDIYVRSWPIKRPGINPLPPESRLPEDYQLSICSEYRDFDAEPEWIAFGE